MQDEHLNFKQFYDIISGKKPDNHARLHRHVESCKKCTEQLSFVKTLYHSMQNSKPGKTEEYEAHVSENMKERYFQQNLSQPEVVKVHHHLVNCHACFEEFSSISAAAFSKPSADENAILEKIEAVEIKDRTAPYEKQQIKASSDLANRIAQLIWNPSGRLSIPKLAMSAVVILILGALGYRQMTWLNLEKKSNRLFAVVLEKNKVGFDAPRLVGSIAGLTSTLRSQKPEDPAIRAAEFALLSALKRQPDDAKLNHRLGTVYFLARDLRKAEQYYLKALALNENDATIYNDLALIEIDQESFEKAQSKLNRAVQLNPELLEAHYNLAILFELQRDTPKAIQAWEKYLELDKDGESDWRKVARSHLRELRE